MGELIQEVRRALGRPPRRWGALARLRLRVRPPAWFRSSDELAVVYRHQGMLLRDGAVVWGALVQANQHLFEPGAHDHPAMAVYSEDFAFDAAPDRLRAIARRLYELKGTAPEDTDQRRLAEIVTDECERALGRVVPGTLTGGAEVRSTALMIFRSHLPDGVLRNGWFPLLVHPGTAAVMVVPWRYWPDELTALWRAGGLGR